MESLDLAILALIVLTTLAQVLIKPARIFEFPGFMAFAFLVFIIPQAFSLVRYPGAVGDSAVVAVLLVSWLCMAACLIGYYATPKSFTFRLTHHRIDERRLFRVGVVFILLGYTMGGALSKTDLQFSENGGLTGTGTILMFFQQLVFPGFAIAFFSVLHRPNLATISASVLGIIPPLQAVIFGRRENAALLALSVGMALFYERGMVPPRILIVCCAIFTMLAIPATGTYRTYAGNKDWERVGQINLVANFSSFLSEGSILELRNGAAIIDSTRQTGNFQFGKAYWNHLIFRYVPAQLLGKDFKQRLMFDIWDTAANAGTETGVKFSNGSTVTGMGDSFQQFGWLGCLFFGMMGVLFKGMWRATRTPNSMLPRVLYVSSVTSAMRAVTHWTLDFLPGLLYFVIFLGAAAVYSARPAKRRVRLNKRKSPSATTIGSQPSFFAGPTKAN